MEVTKTAWGNTPAGVPVFLYRLVNKAGNSISVTNYGATLVAAVMPDKQGVKKSVVLGYDSLKAYLEDTCYLGSTVGRFANRIGQAQFTIDNTVYKVSDNIAPHCLHGGVGGFNARVWDVVEYPDAIQFSLTSPDQDQAFPGEVNVITTYKFSEDNVLTIDFIAASNKATPISLTNHAYFNLQGEGTVYDQELQINSSIFLPMDNDCIVTGAKELVENTPYDFRKMKPIGRDIHSPHPQITLCAGYDESFIIKDTNDGRLQEIAQAYDPQSGRGFKMKSTLPTVHLYTGNFLNSTNPGHEGKKYDKHEAFCLEAQFAPNSPNLTNFPSCILRPGEIYKHQIVIEFTIN